jgi:hypothetical protein
MEEKEKVTLTAALDPDSERYYTELE